MKWLLVLTAALALPPAAFADELKERFRDPPREYSLTPLWSWNSTLTPEKLTWQIDQMVDKGVYGAFMHVRAGLDESRTPYFSEGFWNGVQASVEHAASVGFKTWIYDEDRWPSGAAGGRTMRANPERNTATGLEHESLLLRGPQQKALRFANAKFVIAARSLGGDRIDAKSLIDLSRQQSWDVPSGEWRLCIFRPTHGGIPLPNYINPDTIREFLDNTYEQYAARFGGHFGKTIPGSFFDEIFNIALAWDPILAERFKKAKGYDLETVLPLLYHEGGARTVKVRCDYFEVFTKLYEDAWFRQIAEWCERHKLKLTGHTNESLRHIKDQGDYFRTWRHAQIPGTDNEDFRYTFPRTIGAWKPKQLSSVSHLYGKPRAAVEALGGAGWAITLEQTRYGVNMLAVYGMNSFIFHLFHYAMDSPQSMDDWPNSWFYQNPYWKYFKKLADYVRRVSFLGSQGEHVADVAVLYPVEEVWSHGMTESPAGGDSALVVRLVDRLVKEQIDCDLVDTDSLVRAAPEADGRARIGAERYRVLLLPAARTVSLAAYRRVLELSRNGMKVIAFGATPRHSAENGGDDPEVIRISRELFGDRPPQREDNLAGLVDPDLRVVSGPRDALRFMHRRIGQREVYWLVNTENRPAQWTLQFRATGSVERWDAERGDVTLLSAHEQSLGRTGLHLDFRPWEAYYVVFDRSGAARIQSPRQPGAGSVPALELTSPWTFLAAPKELDEVWKPDPGETLVELPVMDMRIGQQQWRRIKVADPLSPRHGAARYLSAWDAYWITRYTYQRHFGELGGSGLQFRKALDLAFEPSGGWLTVAADERFDCAINGVKAAAGGRKAPPVTLEELPLRRGGNVIDVTVNGPGYLLAEGEVLGPGGEKVSVRSDRGWQVRTPGGDWIPAYEFAFPPFGAWGDLPLRGRRLSLPAVIWYRAIVPPGAYSIERPAVSGGYELLLDGQPVAPGSLPPIRAGAEITLRVRVDEPEDGLLEPLRFRCRPAAARLGDWQDLGLDWYSGRGVYRTTFDLPAPYRGRNLALDLGELRYTGEVWLNGKLVDSLIWPPYTVDVSGFVKPEKNELVVVVANLLANRMRWDIFDSAIPSQFSRWWHDGNILREADHLRSGLLGPVRIRVKD